MDVRPLIRPLKTFKYKQYVTKTVIFALVLGLFGWSLDISGPGMRQAQALGGATGSFTALSSERLLDTRGNVGGRAGKALGAGETMTLRVTGGVAPSSTPVIGAPSGGVSAVMLNVTAVNPTGNGFLSLFPSGTTRTSASTVNLRAGSVTANTTLVRVGTNGTISIFNSSGTTHVVVDIQGWVGTDAAPADAKVTTLTPARILDSRSSTGGRSGVALAAGETMRLPVLGVGGVPASGVAAVAINLAAIPSATGNGSLTAYSTDTPVPSGVSVSYSGGAVTSTFTIVPVGSDGAIHIYNRSVKAHVVADIQAWIATGDALNNAGMMALPNNRILDSRSTLGGRNGQPLGANETMRLPVLGIGGVPASGVDSVTLHVTSVASSTNGAFIIYPSTHRKPIPYTMNFPAGAIVGGTITVPVGPDGAIAVLNKSAGTTHIVAEVQAWNASPILTATPPPAASLTGDPLTQSDSTRAAQILTNTNRYAMTTWWNSVAPGLLSAPLRHDVSMSDDRIRRMGMQALGLSTALATGTYNEATATVPAATAKARTLQLIDRVSSTHIANAPYGWGTGWQGGMWASYTGRAAWLLWPELDTRMQNNVARMIAYEADEAAGWQARYYRNEAGTIITPDNTGAEEIAWAALPMQLATVMFPSHPHTPVWKHQMAHFAIAGWARPADVTSATAVNGASLATWLDGSNVEPNGIVINHVRVAPDYTTNLYQNVDGVLLHSIAGKPSPRALISRLAPVYGAFRSVNFASPPYNAPGGTIYMTNSATVYYPQGIDWGPGQMLPYALVDAQSAAFGFGNSTSSLYEDLHADAQLAKQNRYADRHTYADSTELTYVGREEHAAQLAAQLYLTKMVRDRGLYSLSDEPLWLPPN